MEFLAIEEDEDTLEEELIPIKSMRERRRRSSVRSKLSFHEPADSEQISLSIDYSADLSSRTITDFQPLKVLGIGSYGKVYLVKDVFTSKLFAKKTIKKAKISMDKKLLKTHKNERDILSNINHPNIVKLFYTFHDDDYINFILEFIPGGEIFYHLNNKKRFNEDDTAFYLAEVSLAIRHLHKLGVVYRDLKPENVMLNAFGHVVLTDFGLSSMEETCNSILGTPQFTAPEVLKGESYSYPADWWSFGIMMYDMLIGSTPFNGKTKTDIFDKILKKKIQLPPYLSLYAKDLITKLLNRDANKRFKVDSDFKKFQEHRFFRKINWNDLNDYKVPILPDISNLEDANNFDHDYINEILQNETKNIELDKFDNKLFKGFSFIASKEILEDHFK